MFLETIVIQPTTPDPVTPEIAQEIYGAIKEIRGISSAFVKLGKYEFVYFEDVAKEIEALERVAREEMARPTEQPEEGDPVILRPTSRAELLERLSSEILDVDTFLTDFIDYVMVYKLNTTWAEFEEQFNPIA